MPRTGRPKSENPRTISVMLQLTEDEAAVARAAAEVAGKPLSTYAREKLLTAAKRAAAARLRDS